MTLLLTPERSEERGRWIAKRDGGGLRRRNIVLASGYNDALPPLRRIPRGKGLKRHRLCP